MKTKVIFLFCIVVIALTTLSCNEDPKNPYQQKILGRWICSQINDTVLLTDDIFVLEFKENSSAIYSRGITADDTTKLWVEEDMFCGISNDLMSIKSRPNNVNTATMINLRIKSITDQEMICQVERFLVDTIQYPVGDLYKFKKEKVNYQNTLLGIWKGDYKGNIVIWNYKNTGKYDFYLYDSFNQQYIFSNIDKSFYRLFDNLLVCIYENDATKPVLGRTYESWLLSPDGNQKFQMKALRKTIGEETINIEKINTLL